SCLQCNFTNAMIECIGHEYIPRTVHHNAKRVAQTCVEGRCLVASVACNTNPGNTLNTPGTSIPSPHQMVVRIRDVQISLFIQRDSRWPRGLVPGGSSSPWNRYSPPSPTTVRMIPVTGLTARTLPLKLSAINNVPSEASANPLGPARPVSVAATPSPLYAAVPVPATVQITPVDTSTTLTRLLF